MNSQTQKISESFRRELIASLHRRPSLPVNHPIPKLSLPLRKRGRLAELEQMLRTRVAGPAVVCIALVCSGCTIVRYSSPSGERFSRGSFGTASALSALDVEAGTNGLRRIVLRGYRSDSSDALKTVTEAAVRAAIQPK